MIYPNQPNAVREPCTAAKVDRLTTTEHEKALDFRYSLAALCQNGNDTAGVTLLAGAGTRWVASLKAAGMESAFPADAPRGLYPVENFFGGSLHKIPLAAYSVDAVRNLGKQVIVIRGWQAEIEEKVLTPLGIDSRKVTFVTQLPGPNGKVAGHGDAIWQAQEAWMHSRFVVTNFGGDANSPITVRAGLAMVQMLDEAGIEIGLLLPVALQKNPAYPVKLDESGLPVSFGHNKLGGSSASAVTAVPRHEDAYAYTNIGIRIYRTDWLLRAISEIRSNFWSPDTGYEIPGNDPAGHEFALDNVDAWLASKGAARIAAIANPEELTPAKSFSDIGTFEAAVREVRKEWDMFLSLQKAL